MDVGAEGNHTARQGAEPVPEPGVDHADSDDPFDARGLPASSASDVWASFAYRPTPPIKVRAATHPRRGLEQATSLPLLKTRWKRSKKAMRHLRPLLFYLPYDALEWLPFEWEIDQRLERMRLDVLDGTYRATHPETIRAAKSLGLTRPLAFFEPVDQLLYRNIVALAESDLLQEMQPWTRFGRADGTEAEGNYDPDSGWFRAWLRRNAQLWTITENYDWLVETDISNFFPSIHLDSAMDHLLAHSRLGVDVVRLLSHMLREFAPVPEYRVSPLIGLPQDVFDCSRIIAHSFLGAVDEEFAHEGSHHNFSRYMDDIVIGAQTREEGLTLVARAQHSLEKLGLYPNASKTRIIPRDQFTEDYMKGENDYLGDLAAALKAKAEIDLVEFNTRLDTHLGMDIKPRGWERVLRRYYTLSRQLRATALLRVGFDHVVSYPGSTRSILDYLATFPLTTQRVQKLRRSVYETGRMYQDVRLLALEFLAMAPNRDFNNPSGAVCDWAVSVVEEEHDRNPRLAATAVALLGKFGDATHLDLLAHHFDEYRRDQPAVRRQLLVTLLGAGRVESGDISTYAGESSGMAEACRYLSAIVSGDDRAFYMALGAVKPRTREQPKIQMIPTRAMFLVPWLLTIRPQAVKNAQHSWTARLRTGTRGLDDYAGMRWLGIAIDDGAARTPYSTS